MAHLLPPGNAHPRWVDAIAAAIQLAAISHTLTPADRAGWHCRVSAETFRAIARRVSADVPLMPPTGATLLCRSRLLRLQTEMNSPVSTAKSVQYRATEWIRCNHTLMSSRAVHVHCWR